MFNFIFIFVILLGKEDNFGYFLVNNNGDGEILIDDGQFYKVAINNNKIGNCIKLPSTTVKVNDKIYFKNSKTNIYFKNEDVNTNIK